MAKLSSTQIYGDLQVDGEIKNKATIETEGVVQLSDEINNPSITEGATANSVKKVNDSLSSHKTDTTSHITASERTTWNNKLDKSGGTINGNLVVSGTMQGAVKNYYTSRQASANLDLVGDGSVKHFLATSLMTTSKPGGDGYITHYEWDTTGGYSAQLFVPNNTGNMQFRTMNAGTWSGWNTLYSTKNKPTPADIGASPTSHTHSYLPLSGGTVTGKTIVTGASSTTFNNAQLEVNAPSSGVPKLTLHSVGRSYVSLGVEDADCLNVNSERNGIIKQSNANGYLQLGGQNASYCHIYTSLPSFYFNKELLINGNKVYHVGNKPTPADIGASPSNHTHDYLPLSGGTMSNNATPITLVRSSSPNLNICFQNTTSGSAGTRYLGTYNGTSLRFGSSADLSGAYEIYHTGNKPTPTEIGASPTSHTHNYAGSSSAGGSATSALTCTGNSATATKLATARTLTIGNTGKTFDGSGNVSWTLAEIGASPSSHTHSNYLPTTGGTVSGNLGVTGTANLKNVGVDGNLYVKVNNVATDVGLVLKDLTSTTSNITFVNGWYSVDMSTFEMSSKVTARKTAGVVTIEFTTLMNDYSSYGILGYLPAGFRPSRKLLFKDGFGTGINISSDGTMEITTVNSMGWVSPITFVVGG